MRGRATAWRGAFVLAAAGLLAACGGGGGGGGSSGGGGSTTTVSFQSAATVTVAENATGPVLTVSASASNGAAVGYAISGGVDADKFAIAADGALSFDTPPNYDLFADADGDNVYRVTVRASAGGGSATQQIEVAVTNDREGIAVTRIVAGLTNPVGMAPLFDGLRFVVAERGGRVLVLDGATGQLTENTYVRDNRLPGEILDAMFYFDGSPYGEGVLLLTHSPATGLLLQGLNAASDLTYSRQLAAPWAAPVEARLFPSFGGTVVAAIGDPGGAMAQDLASGYGKLWEIAPGDPYAGASVPSGLVYDVAMIGDGVQSPGGGGIFFQQTMLADAGSTAEHEITLFDRAARPLDFGWPWREGTVAAASNPPAAVNGPSLTYGAGSGVKQGSGIVVGAGYAGTIPGIEGHFVFADKSGAVFSVPSATLNDGFLHGEADIELRTEDFAPNQGSIDSPVAIAIAFQTIFILDADGEVFRVDGA